MSFLDRETNWTTPILFFRFSTENFPKVLKVVDGVAAIAKKYDATSGQVALAWLLAQGVDIIPIPGTRSVKVRFFLLFLHHPSLSLIRHPPSALIVIHPPSLLSFKSLAVLYSTLYPQWHPLSPTQRESTSSTSTTAPSIAMPAPITVVKNDSVERGRTARYGLNLRQFPTD